MCRTTTITKQVSTTTTVAVGVCIFWRKSAASWLYRPIQSGLNRCNTTATRVWPLVCVAQQSHGVPGIEGGRDAKERRCCISGRSGDGTRPFQRHNTTHRKSVRRRSPFWRCSHRHGEQSTPSIYRLDVLVRARLCVKASHTFDMATRMSFSNTLQVDFVFCFNSSSA